MANNNNNNNNNLKIIASFWVMISLVFLIPLNMGVTYGVTQGEVQNSVCGSTNVKSSIILSIVTLCLPGILDKAYEYKQIKCEAATCYYNAVKSGLDPSFCSQHEAYKTCTYIVGEAFAIPPMSILEYWRGAIATALANPLGLLFSGATKAARTVVSGSCTVANSCVFVNVPYSAATLFLVVVDSMAIIQQFKDMFENGFTKRFETNDKCEGIPEIKTEMEKILGKTPSNK